MSAQLDDVLDAFAMEFAPTRDTLITYLKEYPQFAVELTDLFHEIELIGLETKSAQADLRVTTYESQTVAPSLRAALSGENLKSLSKALGLSRALVTAIKDGIIRLETIPGGLLRAMADFIEMDLNQLKLGLADPETSSTALAFKSYEKPDNRIEPISFGDYLEQSSLSMKEREALLDRYGRD